MILLTDIILYILPVLLHNQNIFKIRMCLKKRTANKVYLFKKIFNSICPVFEFAEKHFDLFFKRLKVEQLIYRSIKV